MMTLRLGYVSQALALWNASPGKTMTLTRWQKMDPESRENKLREVTRLNLEHTIRMLHYNIAHDIPLYRFSSSLAPLATHDEAAWDYITPFTDLYKEIGRLVREHNIRPSFHPNQFTLFTSDKPNVTTNAVQDMEYHYHILEAMGLEQRAWINLHVGGAYGDKKAAVARFHENLQQLPEKIKARMTLENDDKTYTAGDVLAVCERENIPMMFDYHHFEANHSDDERLEELLPRFINTWAHTDSRPKIHLSSPKSPEAFRSHADYVDPEFNLPFLQALKQIGEPIDGMIEAKQKDYALLQLVEDLASRRNVTRTGGAELQWK